MTMPTVDLKSLETQSILSLKKPLPEFKINEESEMDPIDLHWYLNQENNVTAEVITFEGGLIDGSPLPDGVVCTNDGAFGGIPEEGTAKPNPYQLEFKAIIGKNPPFIMETKLWIYPVGQMLPEGSIFDTESSEIAIVESSTEADESKTYEEIANYWAKKASGESVDIATLLKEGGLTRSTLYWLLSRSPTITVWNADDLRAPSDGKLIPLTGDPGKFNIHDFGVAMVVSANDIFSSSRTLTDFENVIQKLIEILFEKDWEAIEIAGFDKGLVMLAARLKAMNKKKNKPIKIKNFDTSRSDYLLQQDLLYIP